MIEAIGQNGLNVNNIERGTVAIDDYLRLLVAQFQFQNPLEPVKNGEFLSQIAQFSALQIGQQTQQSIEHLLNVSITQRSLELLGKTVEVEVDGRFLLGTVTGVGALNDGSVLSVLTHDGEVISHVFPTQISLVRE